MYKCAGVVAEALPGRCQRAAGSWQGCLWDRLPADVSPRCVNRISHYPREATDDVINGSVSPGSFNCSGCNKLYSPLLPFNLTSANALDIQLAELIHDGANTESLHRRKANVGTRSNY